MAWSRLGEESLGEDWQAWRRLGEESQGKARQARNGMDRLHEARV